MEWIRIWMGVERISMLKYGIDDIRHFYSGDIPSLNNLYDYFYRVVKGFC